MLKNNFEARTESASVGRQSRYVDFIRPSLMVSTAMILATSVAAAQDQDQDAGSEEVFFFEEIVITSERRVSTVQDTPLAVSAFDDGMLAEQGVSTIQDLAKLAPGLVVGGNAAFEFPISIRGISAAVAGVGADSPTAVYVDGVYMGRPAAAIFQLADVDRIEVLRGPQGTLYGRNAVGGAISIYSQSPSDEFEMFGAASYSDLQEVEVKSSISGPLSDTLRYRISGSYRNTDDWASNTDGRNVLGGEAASLRGALLFEPNGNFNLTLRADFNDMVDPLGSKTLGANGQGFDADFDTFTASEISFGDREFWGMSAEANMTFSDYTLTSITAYRESDHIYQWDPDGTTNRFTRSGQLETQDQFSQELRLSSPGGENFDWILGLYYFNENASQNFYVDVFAAGINVARFSTNTTRSYAAFSHMDWHINPELTMTIGLRYTHEEKDFGFSQEVNPITVGTVFDPLVRFPQQNPYQEFDDSFGAFTPKIGLTWRPEDNLMFYASYSEGFKSGGFNFLRPDEAFDPETVTSYEIGAKTDIFDNRVRLNVSGFYYDYQDLQVRVPGPVGVIFIQNASDAEVYGTEIEMQIAASENFHITASTALLFEAQYTNYVQAGGEISSAGCPGGIFNPADLSCDLSGNRLNRAPSATFSIAAEYDIPLDSGAVVTPMMTFNYESTAFYTEQNEVLAGHDGWHSLDARISYTDPDELYTIAIFGRNLTDNRYVQHTIPITVNNVATATNYPRTFGAQVSFNF